MSAFEYKDGVLCAEDVSLTEISAAVGTPVYCYSQGEMEARYRMYDVAFKDRDTLICYAMKANSNQSVIRSFARLGAGADIVSGGELLRAQAAGVPGDRIVFAGVGKQADEMAQALDAGVYQFNVESEPELELLSQVAASKGQKAPISVRVNPDVDAKTHANITTGTKDNKFGIPWDRARAVYRKASQLPGIEIAGVAVHIGSQLTDLSPLRAAFERMVGLARELRAEGHPITRLDFGGGLGICYDDEQPLEVADYARMVNEAVGDFPARLIFEPGRFLVGNAGILLTKVTYVKHEGRRFVVLDAAMNDLLRPMLYDAWHDFLPITEPAPGAAMEAVDLVGPICESTDRFAEHRLMPKLAAGDLIAIRSAGAYAAVMASTYNSRPLTPEVLVHGDRFAVTRRRQGIEELIALEETPDWQR